VKIIEVDQMGDEDSLVISYGQNMKRRGFCYIHHIYLASSLALHVSRRTLHVYKN
jgi:hypothetical protein